jgi:hypothetical protein
LRTCLAARAAEAEALGADVAAKRALAAAKGARTAVKQQTTRHKKVGALVAALQAKGLSDAEIVAHLTAGNGGAA